MRLLAISDLHGDLDAAWAAVNGAQPDVLLSCGDWGDPGEVELRALQEFTERLPVYTVGDRTAQFAHLADHPAGQVHEEQAAVA